MKEETRERKRKQQVQELLTAIQAHFSDEWENGVIDKNTGEAIQEPWKEQINEGMQPAEILLFLKESLGLKYLNQWGEKSGVGIHHIINTGGVLKPGQADQLVKALVENMDSFTMNEERQKQAFLTAIKKYFPNQWEFGKTSEQDDIAREPWKNILNINMHAAEILGFLQKELDITVLQWEKKAEVKRGKKNSLFTLEEVERLVRAATEFENITFSLLTAIQAHFSDEWKNGVIDKNTGEAIQKPWKEQLGVHMQPAEILRFIRSKVGIKNVSQWDCQSGLDGRKIESVTRKSGGGSVLKPGEANKIIEAAANNKALLTSRSNKEKPRSNKEKLPKEEALKLFIDNSGLKNRNPEDFGDIKNVLRSIKISFKALGEEIGITKERVRQHIEDGFRDRIINLAEAAATIIDNLPIRVRGGMGINEYKEFQDNLPLQKLIKPFLQDTSIDDQAELPDDLTTNSLQNKTTSEALKVITQAAGIKINKQKVLQSQNTLHETISMLKLLIKDAQSAGFIDDSYQLKHDIIKEAFRKQAKEFLLKNLEKSKKDLFADVPYNKIIKILRVTCGIDARDVSKQLPTQSKSQEVPAILYQIENLYGEAYIMKHKGGEFPALQGPDGRIFCIANLLGEYMQETIKNVGETVFWNAIEATVKKVQNGAKKLDYRTCSAQRHQEKTFTDKITEDRSNGGNSYRSGR